MTEKDKEVILRELCSRLPYGVKVLHEGWNHDTEQELNTVETVTGVDDRFVYTVLADGTADKHPHQRPCLVDRPFLRTFDSLTDDEADRLGLFGFPVMEYGTDERGACLLSDVREYVDYCNSIHYDYGGLIGKGLAMEAPEGMYSTKTEWL